MTRPSPAAAASDVPSDAIAATPRDAREGARAAASDARSSACESPIRPRSHSRHDYYGARGGGRCRDEKYRRHPDRPPTRRPSDRPPPASSTPSPRAIADSPRRASRSPTTRARRCPSTARTPITSPRRCARVRRRARARDPRARRTRGTSRHLTPARAGVASFPSSLPSPSSLDDYPLPPTPSQASRPGAWSRRGSRARTPTSTACGPSPPRRTRASTRGAPRGTRGAL